MLRCCAIASLDDGAEGGGGGGLGGVGGEDEGVGLGLAVGEGQEGHHAPSRPHPATVPAQGPAADGDRTTTHSHLIHQFIHWTRNQILQNCHIRTV